MWQKCPICNGEGKIFGNFGSFTSMNTSIICSTCKGHKIISTITGLPPSSIILESTDFKDKGETQQEYYGK